MLEDFLPYKFIDEIPYEVVTDELKDDLSYDYKLLTIENLDQLEEGIMIRYIPYQTNNRSKKAKFICFTDDDRDVMKLTHAGKSIYVCLETNTIFYRYRKTNELRRSLENLVKTNFKIVKLPQEHVQTNIHFLYEND